MKRRGLGTAAIVGVVALALFAAPAVAVEAPAILSPAPGAVVNQATTSIVLAPHNGSIVAIYVAPSPVTDGEFFGSPPGSGLGLHYFSGLILGGPQGSTTFPLSGIIAANRYQVLAPGTYYFRFEWTETVPGGQYCSVENQDGSCQIFGTLPPQYFDKYSTIGSFVIAAPPPATPAPVAAPVTTVQVTQGCRHAKSLYRFWAGEVRHRVGLLHKAKTKTRRTRARAALTIAVAKRSNWRLRSARDCST